ncbi:hypothetical protein ACVXG7_10165 [Enterobacter hormaechei]
MVLIVTPPPIRFHGSKAPATIYRLAEEYGESKIVRSKNANGTARKSIGTIWMNNSRKVKRLLH